MFDYSKAQKSKRLSSRKLQNGYPSLCSKRSRTKRTKFVQRVLVFCTSRDARKMGREQKGGRKGVGEGKEGNACLQSPRF